MDRDFWCNLIHTGHECSIPLNVSDGIALALHDNWLMGANNEPGRSCNPDPTACHLSTDPPFLILYSIDGWIGCNAHIKPHDMTKPSLAPEGDPIDLVPLPEGETLKKKKPPSMIKFPLLMP